MFVLGDLLEAWHRALLRAVASECVATPRDSFAESALHVHEGELDY